MRLDDAEDLDAQGQAESRLGHVISPYLPDHSQRWLFTGEKLGCILLDVVVAALDACLAVVDGEQIKVARMLLHSLQHALQYHDGRLLAQRDCIDDAEGRNAGLSKVPLLEAVIYAVVSHTGGLPRGGRLMPKSALMTAWMSGRLAILLPFMRFMR